MFSARMIDILKFLAKEKETSFKEIETATGIKERNIRYDIERINNILYLKNLPMIKKEAKGSLLFPDDINYEELTLENEYIFSQDERVELMKLVLLLDKNNFKLNKFAEKFNVSRSTVKNDLKVLDSYFSEEKIKIEYNNGFTILGDSKAIASMMRKGLVKHIYLFLNDIDKLSISEEYCKNVIETSFKDSSIKEIIQWVNELLNGINCILTDESYKWYVVSILVFCLYVKNSLSYPLEGMNTYEKDILDKDKMQKLYIEKLERILKHTIDKNDMNTVIWLLYYTNKYSCNIEDSYERIDIEALVANLIDLMSKEMKLNFERDLILSAGLINHITPLINRINNNLIIEEDIISLLDDNGFIVCDAVKKVISEINILKNVKDDNEIAYIAIHFIASMKRINEGITKKVLVVCRFGYGTSIMLKEALTSQYNVKIVDTIPAYKINEYKNRTDIDVIISTSKLKGIKKPLIVLKSISDIENYKELQTYGIVRKKIIPRYDSIYEKLNFLTEEQRIKVMEILNSELGYQYESNRKSINKLTDILDERSIKYIDEELPWKEAINICCKILEDNDFVNEKYVQNILDCVEMFGFYSVSHNSIALFHGNKSEYVYKSAMSLVITKEPILFGDKKSNILFCFGSKDKKDSIPALVVLMRIIKSTSFLKEVVKCKNSAEIYKIIKRCELEVL